MARPLKNRASPRRSTRAGRNGRPSADGGARRAELVASAARVFARKGVGNTTMRDIADETGILPGSLYHHFESKDALLEEVLRSVLEELTVQYTEVREAELPPTEAMEALFLVGLRFVVEQHDVTAIVQNDYTYLHDVEAFSFVEDFSARHRRIWRDVLERGVSAGVFRSDLDLDVAYRSMMGSIVSAVRWYRPRPRSRVEDMARAHASLFLDGLVRRP